MSFGFHRSVHRLASQSFYVDFDSKKHLRNKSVVRTARQKFRQRHMGRAYCLWMQIVNWIEATDLRKEPATWIRLMECSAHVNMWSTIITMLFNYLFLSNGKRSQKDTWMKLVSRLGSRTEFLLNIFFNPNSTTTKLLQNPISIFF